MLWANVKYISKALSQCTALHVLPLAISPRLSPPANQAFIYVLAEISSSLVWVLLKSNIPNPLIILLSVVQFTWGYICNTSKLHSHYPLSLCDRNKWSFKLPWHTVSQNSDTNSLFFVPEHSLEWKELLFELKHLSSRIQMEKLELNYHGWTYLQQLRDELLHPQWHLLLLHTVLIFLTFKFFQPSTMQLSKDWNT